jgi:N-acetylglutamate synthase-like GNAT family acetyltransferase
VITRATRHDRADLAAFLAAHGIERDLAEGVAFIAREGAIVGCVRLVEVAPQTLVVDDLLVAEHKRGAGLGEQLLQAAMNSRGGTLYAASTAEHAGLFRRSGFTEVPEGDLPGPVTDYLTRVGDHPRRPGRIDTYLRAR